MCWFSGHLKKPPATFTPQIINNIFNFPGGVRAPHLTLTVRLYLFCFCEVARVRLLILLGKGGSALTSPEVFSDLFLSSNTTDSRPTMTPSLASLWSLRFSSLTVSLTAFLSQLDSVWPRLGLEEVRVLGNYQCSLESSDLSNFTFPTRPYSLLPHPYSTGLGLQL